MHPGRAKQSVDRVRLDSWKGIAAYLGRDERTAKRWEKTRGLPVHRWPGMRSGVFAFEDEIDEWQQQSAVQLVEREADEAACVTLKAEAFAKDLAVEKPALESTSPANLLSPIKSPAYQAPALMIGGALLFLALAGVFMFIVHRARVYDLHFAASPTITHIPSKEVEDLYLNGRYFWNRRTPESLQAALEYFKKAVERDPNYAEAYIGLADTYSLMVEFSMLPPRQAYPPAIEAASRAIKLNPALSEAHRSLAFSSFYWNGDRTLSEKEFRTALAFAPRDATAHHWFANTLMVDQRYEDAMEEINEARKLDPTAISILADRAHILALMGRTQEARETLFQIEHSDPAFLSAHWYLADIYLADKNYPAYLTELRQIAGLTHREADAAVNKAAEKGFAAGGEKGMYEELAAAEIDLFRKELVPAFDVASALARSGRTTEAIQYLKLSCLNRDTQFLTISWPQILPMLKKNPAFIELAAKSNQVYQESTEIAQMQ